MVAQQELQPRLRVLPQPTREKFQFTPENIAALGRDDPDTWQQLDSDKRLELTRIGYSITHSWQDAEDGYQETMTKILKATREQRINPHPSAEGYINTANKNTNLDQLTKSQRQQKHELPTEAEVEVKPGEFIKIYDIKEDTPSPEEIAITQEASAALNTALNGLPPSQRAVISLSYIQNYTHEEIAQILGIPLGTLKTRIRLALARLRQNPTILELVK